jgi:hypothetical protein
MTLDETSVLPLIRTRQLLVSNEQRFQAFQTSHELFKDKQMGHIWTVRRCRITLLGPNFKGSLHKFCSRISQDPHILEPFLSRDVLALEQFGAAKVFKVENRPALAKVYKS